ncbi:hypothetical protein [Escherichia coli]|uniref:hypothetical protein n=1 Tax=Escherichia coli TaxID=562 RepID=UPI0030F4759C
MTNAEAAEIMQRVRNSGKQAQYDRLAGIIDDMLARRRELIREAGLERTVWWMPGRKPTVTTVP